MRRRSGSRLVQASFAAALVVASYVVATGSADAVTQPRTLSTPGGATRFVPVTSAGVFSDHLGAGATRTITIAGRHGVAAAAKAVSLEVMATHAHKSGKVTVYAANASRPGGATLLVHKGEPIVNAAVVPLSGGGAVKVHTTKGVDVSLAVAGYFEAATTARGGRYRALSPARIASPTLSKGQAKAVEVAGHGGVPTGHVSAVVLELTYSSPAGDGAVTAYPAGSSRPATPQLSIPGQGRKGTNLVVVRLPAGGKVNLFSSTRTDVAVDVAGYFTNGTVPVGSDGLFVPKNSRKLYEVCAGCNYAPGQFAFVKLSSEAGLPEVGLHAVVVNITMTQAAKAGRVLADPMLAKPLPSAATLTLDRAHQGRAALSWSAVGQIAPGPGEPQAGFMRINLGSGGHLRTDIAGWFTASGPCTVRSSATDSGLTGAQREFRLFNIALSGQALKASTTNGICHEWPVIQRWYEQQGDGRTLRTRGSGARLEVNEVALALTHDDLLNGDTGDNLRMALSDEGYSDTHDTFVAYIDTTGPACAETFPSSHVVVLYEKSCSIYPTVRTFRWPSGATYVVAHEAAHDLGAVPACAPHSDGTGHVDNDNRDLLYAGPGDRDWEHLRLDPGHDDYYMTSGACLDIADASYWVP